MNIIKTELVDAQYDILWDDITALIGDATPRPVLVIVNTYGAGNAEEMQLKKMLDACKLLPEQYNILQMEHGQMVAWHQLRDRLQPEIIFLIGVLPSQLGISALFSMNYPNSFDGKTWLAQFPWMSWKKCGSEKAIVDQWNETGFYRQAVGFRNFSMSEE